MKVGNDSKGVASRGSSKWRSTSADGRSGSTHSARTSSWHASATKVKAFCSTRDMVVYSIVRAVCHEFIKSNKKGTAKVRNRFFSLLYEPGIPTMLLCTAKQNNMRCTRRAEDRFVTQQESKTSRHANEKSSRKTSRAILTGVVRLHIDTAQPSNYMMNFDDVRQYQSGKRLFDPNF